jgi:hypothetical protein
MSHEHVSSRPVWSPAFCHLFSVYGRARRGEQIKFRTAPPLRCFELNDLLLGRPGDEPQLLTTHCRHGIDICGP